ncbi:MAG TPA: hypothetical protein G4O16_02960 [Dehalococcoidia bacterium]|nr:hypothetical protein [Dehalococcoidia bacterium]
MTDEELEKLRQDVSVKLEQLPATPDEQLDRRERRHRTVLRARIRALERMKKARQEGNVHQEARAGLDYTLLTEYGERNIFLYNIMKARLFWWRGI